MKIRLVPQTGCLLISYSTAAVIVFQIDANFDGDEAAKCLYWIKLMTGVDEIPDDPNAIDVSFDGFYALLCNGIVLLRWVSDVDRIIYNYICRIRPLHLLHFCEK